MLLSCNPLKLIIKNFQRQGLSFSKKELPFNFNKHFFRYISCRHEHLDMNELIFVGKKVMILCSCFSGTNVPSRLLFSRITCNTLEISCQTVVKIKWDCNNHVNVVVNFFILGYWYFFFVSPSLAYITILKNKTKTKITWDKKLTTT